MVVVVMILAVGGRKGEGIGVVIIMAVEGRKGEGIVVVIIVVGEGRREEGTGVVIPRHYPHPEKKEKRNKGKNST